MHPGFELERNRNDNHQGEMIVMVVKGKMTERVTVVWTAVLVLMILSGFFLLSVPAYANVPNAESIGKECFEKASLYFKDAMAGDTELNMAKGYMELERAAWRLRYPPAILALGELLLQRGDLPGKRMALRMFEQYAALQEKPSEYVVKTIERLSLFIEMAERAQ